MLSDIHTLVLGGAASGKSAFAEQQVLTQGKPAIYVATSQAYDAEMSEKIEIHKSRRDHRWRTIEEPLDLTKPLKSVTSNDVILIDCITLWLTNLMMAEADIDAAQDALLAALADCPCPVTMVSNDVSGGITPDNAMARQFQRIQGQCNQKLAAAVGTVVLVTAGLPQVLKAPTT